MSGEITVEKAAAIVGILILWTFCSFAISIAVGVVAVQALWMWFRGITCG